MDWGVCGGHLVYLHGILRPQGSCEREGSANCLGAFARQDSLSRQYPVPYSCVLEPGPTRKCGWGDALVVSMSNRRGVTYNISCVESSYAIFRRGLPVLNERWPSVLVYTEVFLSEHIMPLNLVDSAADLCLSHSWRS